MRLTLPTKLLAITATATAAFILIISSGSIRDQQIAARMTTVRERYIPRIQLRPALERDLETMSREFQDAVAAQDGDALEHTNTLVADFVSRVDAARGAIDPATSARLRTSIRAYHSAGMNVSRRMILGEGGEELVDSIDDMQRKRAQTAALITRATEFRPEELSRAFAVAANAQADGARERTYVTVGSLALLLLISFWIARNIRRSSSHVTEGLERFGKGVLDRPIPVLSGDELGDVAVRANEMAANLDRLARERERTEHLKGIRVALAQELRGELEPSSVAERALRVITQAIGAPAAALFYADAEGTFHLLGHCAASQDGAGPSPVIRDSFRAGEGLVGEAAARDEIVVVADPPAGYLRVRSGLGEAAPRSIVLAPLAHGGRVRGVIELAMFQPWTDDLSEILRSTHETVAIAIEVARARVAMRDLLLATQKQAAQLTAQEEELRSTNEELQTQQEELRQVNDDLGAQARELEEQRRALEEKNQALDEASRVLEAKAAELATVSEYKSQFLANMSHELRTPLNSMLLLSNLLSENQAGNLTAKQVEYCKTINSAGADLLVLINEVLDLAKVEAGKQTVRRERVTLAQLVENAERLFGPAARDKGVAFVTALSAGLPDAIESDAKLVMQVLNNLLSNAVKFTARGQIGFRISPLASTVRLARRDLDVARTIAITVTDTGPGIAPEHHERIFAPFEQVEGATARRHGGTGLGLTIARELAGLLGGELALESTVGRGTTFTLYLPHANRATEDAQTPERPPSRSTDLRALTPSTPLTTRPAPRAQDDRSALAANDTCLLVIEDDPIFAEALGGVIHGEGLKYVVATEGAEGYELARRLKPAGIVLDVLLPRENGWQIMEKLRADPVTAAIPVHFVSAVEGAERGLAMGAIGYLTKPASKQDLVRVVDALAPSRSRGQLQVLVVEGMSPSEIVPWLAAEGHAVERVKSAEGALGAMVRGKFGCVVLDLTVASVDVLALLHAIESRPEDERPGTIVYTDRALSKAETQRLEAYAEAVVLKQGASTERLLEEIRLFARRLRSAPGATVRRPEAGAPKDVRLEGMRILVVDDDMRTVYALSAILRSKGATVRVADSGVAALAALDEDAGVDVVLMDIMMPEMDGYAAMRRIRQIPSFAELPIVALTAKAMRGDEAKCLEAGASAYSPKPVDAERLVELLGGYVQRSTARERDN